jgi:hypothetical protein
MEYEWTTGAYITFHKNLAIFKVQTQTNVSDSWQFYPHMLVLSFHAEFGEQTSSLISAISSVVWQWSISTQNRILS